MQETRWEGKSAKELGVGFKIFYSGEKDSKDRVKMTKDLRVEIRR